VTCNAHFCGKITRFAVEADNEFNNLAEDLLLKGLSA
jgi:hypothetical protein